MRDLDIQALEVEQRKAIARMITEIDYQVQDITNIYEDAFGLCVCIGDEEWYVFLSIEDAEEAVSCYWEDMMQHDPEEFVCIIGEKRLYQWALNQFDEFGISSAEEFFDTSKRYCEETLASYDGKEHEIDGIYFYRRN